MFEQEIKKLQEVLKYSRLCNNSELYWLEFKTKFKDEESMLELLGKNISGIANSCTYNNYKIHCKSGFLKTNGGDDGNCPRVLWGSLYTGTLIEYLDYSYFTRNTQKEIWDLCEYEYLSQRVKDLSIR